MSQEADPLESAAEVDPLESAAEADPTIAPPPTAPRASAGNKRALRNKIVLLGGVVAVVLIVGVSVVTRTRTTSQSLPAEVKGVQELPPPGEMVQGETALASSPLYSNVISTVNKERLDEAERAGRSGMPLADTIRPASPAGSAASAGAGPGQEAAQANQSAQAAQLTQADLQARQQALVAQMNQIQKFMGDRRDAWAPKGTAMITVTDGSTVAASQTAARPTTAAAPGADPGSSAPKNQVTLIPAGTLLSAVTVNQVNTDLTVPLVATIASGQFAGAKIIGSPERVGDVAKIEFTTMSLPGYGTSVPIKAYSLDESTLEGGVATSVDRKLFAKYLLRPAAAAVAAVGAAAKNAGTTTVNINGATTQTTGELTNKRARQIMTGALGEQASKDMTAESTDPTVHVARRTVIGVIFVSDVTYTPPQ